MHCNLDFAVARVPRQEVHRLPTCHSLTLATLYTQFLSHCHWYSLLKRGNCVKGGHALAVSEEGLQRQGLFTVIKLFPHLLSHFIHTEL